MMTRRNLICDEHFERVGGYLSRHHFNATARQQPDGRWYIHILADHIPTVDIAAEPGEVFSTMIQHHSEWVATLKNIFAKEK